MSSSWPLGVLVQKNSTKITTSYVLHSPNTWYSGFHVDPELASRAAGAPPGRSTREAIGGVGPIVTTSRHKPFSEFSNFDYLQS
jgi:hypothetical protein